MATQSQLDRLDAIINRRLSEEEDADRLAAARRADTVRERQRENAEQRRLIAERYDDSFRSFGTEVPAPVDDEPVGRYRARLFNRLARRLPPTNEWADTRADDISSATAMDKVEMLVLEAARREGERPSASNLPDDGSMISRIRTDEDTGLKSVNWYGKESYIKQMSRGGHRVLRVIDPKSRSVLWGAPFSKAD